MTTHGQGWKLFWVGIGLFSVELFGRAKALDLPSRKKLAAILVCD